ncbi:hypothetical protein LCGC14_2484260 [marine sediment metagenome]|uniref:PD-(D/E)XK endonuclease-like domain-containing protein n=1 Tax=marine sediment metagenome TaxID=412755 RepID=A0A0F9DIL0_9ZZZZ
MISFRESDHSYWLNDVRVPGVNEIIEAVGLTDPAAKKNYTPFHAARGKALHKATYLHDMGVLDESSIDPEIAGCFEAYKLFVKQYIPTWFNELIVFNSDLFYVGTLDRFGQLSTIDDSVIIDIKTGQKAKWHAIQLALYAIALTKDISTNPKLYGLYLKKDGTFKASRDLVDYTSPDIYKVAEAVTRVFHWKDK